MNETIGNLNFLKESISKFKGELKKMISDPQYTNSNAITLKMNIEQLERNIIDREKLIVDRMLRSSPFESMVQSKTLGKLPDINSHVYTTLTYTKRGKSTLKSHTYQEEKSAFKEQLVKRRLRDDSHGRILALKDNFLLNKQRSHMLKKHNIQEDHKIIPNYSEHKPNLLNSRDKIRKSVNRNYFRAITYDKYCRPIIAKDEIEKGLLNMIYKGLIPKSADLTPAFSTINPMSINSRIHPIKFEKEEIETEDYYTKRNKIEVVEPKIDESPIRRHDTCLFITSNAQEDKQDNITSLDLKEPEDQVNEIEQGSNLELNNTSSSDEDKDKTEANEIEVLQMKDISEQATEENKLYITFSFFKVIHNQEFNLFKSKNEAKWGSIVYIIEHLQKIFHRLNIKLIEVDCNKLESLAKNEVRKVSSRDLINCIREEDLDNLGLRDFNERQFINNIIEAKALVIQTFYRRYIAYKKLRVKLLKLNHIKTIQRIWKIYKVVKNSKQLIKARLSNEYEKWKIMMNTFKAKWAQIKKSPRIEIHINSLSYSFYKNSTTEKFIEKQNNQLTRLMSLADPNVEIIYISPYHLTNEVLSYYFSILKTLGIEDAKERFHLIVPDIAEKMPPHFSLTQLLFYSTKSIQTLRYYIKDKHSYIVPGMVSRNELLLSMYLECPILFGDVDITLSLLSKSGAKRVFELNEIAIPISSWDIKTEEDFFNSLTQLVENYPSVNIWIFKVDNEYSGRGIAYLQLDKVKSIVELKKNRNSMTSEVFHAKLDYILRRNLSKKVEIVTSKLYSNWDEFFSLFKSNGGVIESCPTNSLTGVIGSPAISFMIEPDGNCELLFTYDKLNTHHFRNFGAISPQVSIPNLNSELIVNKIGYFLYKQGIFGAVTVEFVAFRDGKEILFWGIDLKFGYSDIISSLKFNELLYTKSKQVLELSSLDVEENSMEVKNSMKPAYSFVIPFLVHPEIANFRMKEIVNLFRTTGLVFEMEKRNGIVFNLADIFQCGVMGLSGMVNGESSIYDLYDILEHSVDLIKSQIGNNEHRRPGDGIRSDLIDLSDIIGRVKMIVKTAMKEKEIINRNEKRLLTNKERIILNF